VKNLARNRRYHVEPILEVPVSQTVYWKEDNLRALGDAWGVLMRKVMNRVKPVERSESVAVGVVDSQEDRPRLVVIGSVDLATNPWVLRDPRYYDFLENCLQWLRERGDKLGISPVESSRFTINKEDVNLARMQFLPLWLMAVGIISLGVGLWVVRRR
jgi:hypothetical protein